MTRPIDADAAIGGVKNRCLGQNDVVKVEHSIISMLYMMPTIEIEPHWIPCNERLPEDDRSKVVTLANGKAEVGYYSNGDWWCVGDKVTLENQTVIAWMPLPKPYEVNHE